MSDASSTRDASRLAMVGGWGFLGENEWVRLRCRLLLAAVRVLAVPARQNVIMLREPTLEFGHQLQSVFGHVIRAAVQDCLFVDAGVQALEYGIRKPMSRPPPDSLCESGTPAETSTGLAQGLSAGYIGCRRADDGRRRVGAEALSPVDQLRPRCRERAGGENATNIAELSTLKRRTRRTCLAPVDAPGISTEAARRTLFVARRTMMGNATVPIPAPHRTAIDDTTAIWAVDVARGHRHRTPPIPMVGVA